MSRQADGGRNLARTGGGFGGAGRGGAFVRAAWRQIFPFAPGEGLDAGAGELFWPQHRGAAADDNAPARADQPARQLTRLALSLGGNAAAQHQTQVGFIAIVHRRMPGGDQRRQSRLAIGLAHLAADKGGVDARHAAITDEKLL